MNLYLSVYSDQALFSIPRSTLSYLFALSQQTWGIHPLLDQCWATVVDGGPTLSQQWVSDSCLFMIEMQLLDIEMSNVNVGHIDKCDVFTVCSVWIQCRPH